MPCPDDMAKKTTGRMNGTNQPGVTLKKSISYMASKPQPVTICIGAMSARLTWTATKALLMAGSPRKVTVSSIGQEMLPEHLELLPVACGQ
jgi:hypothetical protein